MIFNQYMGGCAIDPFQLVYFFVKKTTLQHFFAFQELAPDRLVDGLALSSGSVTCRDAEQWSRGIRALLMGHSCMIYGKSKRFPLIKQVSQNFWI